MIKKNSLLIQEKYIVSATFIIIHLYTSLLLKTRSMTTMARVKKIQGNNIIYIIDWQ